MEIWKSQFETCNFTTNKTHSMGTYVKYWEEKEPITNKWYDNTHIQHVK